jgi:hypothetical protein
MQYNGTDRRKHLRFQIKDHAFVIFDEKHTQLGEIVDIGFDGVAVRYLVDGQGVGATKQIDIMMGADNFYLDNVPVTKISEREELTVPLSTMVTRIAAMQFGTLTTEQQYSLESFINRNSLPATA